VVTFLVLCPLLTEMCLPRRLPFANRIGIDWAYITLALITACTSLGIIVLMYKGEQWRKMLGQPQFHKDI
jgi:hypothetical protein